jgi:hypothetical protein
MFGSPGGDVSEERLIDAWVDVWMTVAEAATAKSNLEVVE